MSNYNSCFENQSPLFSAENPISHSEKAALIQRWFFSKQRWAEQVVFIFSESETKSAGKHRIAESTLFSADYFNPVSEVLNDNGRNESPSMENSDISL